MLLCIVPGALLYILICLQFYHPQLNPFGMGSDSRQYWELSKNLAKQGNLHYDSVQALQVYDPLFITEGFNLQDIPSIGRLPGYPFILALFRSAYDHIFVAYLINFLSYVGICIYGYLLFSYLLGENRNGFRLYFVTLVFSPIYFVWTGVQSDIFASFLYIAFTYHLFQVQKSNNNKNLMALHFLTTVTVGVWCNLTRPNLIPFTVLFSGIFILKEITKDKRKLFCNCSIFLLLILSVVSWSYRNYLLTNHMILSDRLGNELFLNYLHYDISPDDDLYQLRLEFKHKSVIKKMKYGISLHQALAEVDLNLKKISIEYILARPFETASKMVRSIKAFFVNSYFDISGVMLYFPKPIEEKAEYLSTGVIKYENTFDRIMWQITFQASRWYKIGLAGVFAIFPFFLMNKSFVQRHFNSPQEIVILYISTFLCLMITAILTSSASGERTRMPFHPVMNLLASVLIYSVFDVCKKSLSKKKPNDPKA